LDRLTLQPAKNSYPPKIRGVLKEAHRVLVADGLLCVVGMTQGQGAVSRAVCAAWSGLHALNPHLVGGCRPLRVKEFLDADEWRVKHSEVLCAWGVCSEVVAAKVEGD
jgi:hypothetical protein